MFATSEWKFHIGRGKGHRIDLTGINISQILVMLNNDCQIHLKLLFDKLLKNSHHIFSNLAVLSFSTATNTDGSDYSAISE